MFKGASILMILCFLFECYAAIHAPLCILFVFIIGAMMCSILHTTFKTNRIIAELKEQKGEPVNTSNGPSPILIMGLLLNSVALMSEPVPDIIEYPLRILAIGFIVYGIIKSFSQKEL